jgi:AraC-like DNA-binding protein
MVLKRIFRSAAVAARFREDSTFKACWGDLLCGVPPASAHADGEEGLENGANDYVAKPFDMSEMCARIDRLLDSRLRLECAAQLLTEDEQATVAEVAYAVGYNSPLALRQGAPQAVRVRALRLRGRKIPTSQAPSSAFFRHFAAILHHVASARGFIANSFAAVALGLYANDKTISLA